MKPIPVTHHRHLIHIGLAIAGLMGIAAIFPPFVNDECLLTGEPVVFDSTVSISLWRASDYPGNSMENKLIIQVPFLSIIISMASFLWIRRGHLTGLEQALGYLIAAITVFPLAGIMFIIYRGVYHVEAAVVLGILVAGGGLIAFNCWLGLHPSWSSILALQTVYLAGASFLLMYCRGCWLIGAWLALLAGAVYIAQMLLVCSMIRKRKPVTAGSNAL